MRKLNHLLLVSIFSLFLSACGGGGSDAPPPPPPPPPPPVNVAPTADAGADQAVNEGDTVDLAGSGTDSDGTVSTYAWTRVSGPSVTFADAAMQNTTFTAPSTGAQASETVTLRLTVTDDDNATGSDDVVVTINTTNIGPSANAGPDQSVDEQSVVTLDGSASSDADGSIASYEWMVLTGPGVSISDSSAVSPTFDAPSLGAAENITISLTVTDDRGFTDTDEVIITVNPVPGLNSAPLADAGPAQTVTSGETVTLDGSLSTDSDGTIASYAWAQLSGTPTVTLTAANTANATFIAPTVTADTVLSFIVTVTDNEGATADNSVEITIMPMPAMVEINGKATYDNVPHNPATNGLDYTNITRDPIRGAVVELIQGSSISQSSVTDLNGDYSFEVNPNSGTYFVRIKSQALSTTTTAQWDFKVVDNTNTQALYVLDGSSFTVNTSNVMRPTMRATTSFNGTVYTNRSGAPFHILDRIMDGILRIQTVDPDVNFPELDVNWSVNNSGSAAGTLANLRTGAGAGSFFTVFGSDFAEFSGRQLFLLGNENIDTDEYDGHIVLHEWGHYFENALSRSDSIGGLHRNGERLDKRLAFGEGFGYAWAGIITDDPVTFDSLGSAQSGTNSFNINVELNNWANPGWYSEGSIQSIIYDMYDSVNDGVDNVSLGFSPIYSVLTDEQRNTEAFTSIYSFATYIKNQAPASVAGIDSLLSGQSVIVNDIWGTGETNDAGAPLSRNVLPVYTEVTVGGAPVEVCSVDDFDPTDDGNKLSNFRYARFTTTAPGNHRFIIPAAVAQDPDLVIYRQGNLVGQVAAGGDNQGENAIVNLPSPGVHTLEAYEFDNTFRGNLANSADECFTIQIQTAP